MTEIAGKVAVVTGAARGIGAAVAKRLAGLGATVLLVARDKTKLAEIEEEIRAGGGTAIATAVDLTDTDAVSAFTKSVVDRFGRCDILVNNAGIATIGTLLHETNPEVWNALMDTNLRAPYLMIRGLAPLMIEARSGQIINISSLAGRNPVKGAAAYSASKWGLNGLTYSVAEELREYGIRVSVIAPGSVNSGFSSLGTNEAEGGWKIQPDDIAEAVAMLVTQSPTSFISEVLLRPAQRKP
jgi:3-oxoacyl-[acyl-carrier protein] reductase